MSRCILILSLCFASAVAFFPPMMMPPPPCGLPPFLDKLPAEAKSKIQEIWKNYKQGDKCYNEHGLTREVIDSLPKEDRKKIHPRGPPMPPFLINAPKDIQDQFEAIHKDRSIPKDQKPAKFQELANKILSGSMLEEFNKFHNKMQEHKKDLDEKVTQLSPEAKTAWDKLERLEEQKREIFGSVSESVRDELFDVIREKFPFGKFRRFGRHRQ